eukprot:TRINITY_DN11710_c0_g1_i1.p1 TRINITY_DN11710_c0_g1~~TRINITY_DN11710_c0_g1_i1.p1  ORF type:complete len:126 (-),score=47.65 TRINITY_DN11710_c0_g1_i1:96-473(-)
MEGRSGRGASGSEDRSWLLQGSPWRRRPGSSRWRRPLPRSSLLLRRPLGRMSSRRSPPGKKVTVKTSAGKKLVKAAAKKKAVGKKSVPKKTGAKKVMKKVSKASAGAKIKKGSAKPKKVDKKAKK